MLRAASAGAAERALGSQAIGSCVPLVEALARAGDSRVPPEIPEVVRDLAVEAIRWVGAGYPVLPVVVEANGSANSHSRWRKRPATENGIDGATTDLIDFVWRLRDAVRCYPPQPGRSLALGVLWASAHPQGGFVASVDVDDEAVFAAIERQLGGLPRSHLIRTQSGGRAFVALSRRSYPTRTKLCGRAGVEWRQERALSVVAGKTPDGKTWKAEFDPAAPPPFVPETWEEAAAKSPEPDLGSQEPVPAVLAHRRLRDRPPRTPVAPSSVENSHAEARAVTAELLRDPLLGPNGEPLQLRSHGLRASRKGLRTWLRCATSGETLLANASRHVQVFHAGIFAGQLARDEGLPAMEALGVLLASAQWRALAAEHSERGYTSRAVDEIRSFVEGMRKGARLPPRREEGELVPLPPESSDAPSLISLVEHDPTAAVLAVVAAGVTGAISRFPPPSMCAPVVSGFDPPAWAASHTAPSLERAAYDVVARVGRPTVLRTYRPATEVVSSLVGVDRPCTVVTARRLLHAELRQTVPGLRDLSDADSVRGRGDSRRVAADRASLIVHNVARREVPKGPPGLLVIVDAALVARTLAQMRAHGIGALRALRAHVAAGWGVVVSDPFIDAETAHELLIALGANLGDSAWIDVEGTAGERAVEWLEAPTGNAQASAHAHGMERVLSLLDGGEAVLLAVAAASNIDDFGRLRRFLTEARPDVRVAVLDSNTDPSAIEQTEDAQLVLASPAAFGLALQRPRHVVALPSPCPGLGAVDARRMLGLVREPLSLAVAPTKGGGGPLVDAEGSAARHRQARAHTRALAGAHLPVIPGTDAQLVRALGRLRESMVAVSWRQANVYDGLCGLLTAEGIGVRFVERIGDEAMVLLANRLRTARDTGELARAEAICIAPDIGHPDAERLRRLPRWKLCLQERLALEKRDITNYFPSVVWNPEVRAFRPAEHPLHRICPELVLRDKRGQHRARVSRFVVADLLARGESLAALTVARGELQDDGNTSEYIVEGALVAIGILTKLTRGPADARLQDGLATWLAQRVWASDDAELRASMASPEMAVLLHRAVVALHATWTPSSSVSQVVGDLLERLGVATLSIRPRRRARTYSVELRSLEEVDLLGSAERDRLRHAAVSLLPDLREGAEVTVLLDAHPQRTTAESERVIAGGASTG